jgi:hypothetical protein
MQILLKFSVIEDASVHKLITLLLSYDGVDNLLGFYLLSDVKVLI